MKPFSVDYYLLVTLSAVGLFQLIANHRRLNGIKIFQNSFITVAFGCLLPISINLRDDLLILLVSKVLDSLLIFVQSATTLDFGGKNARPGSRDSRLVE